MAALEPHYMAILKQVLSERFVPLLPPLLNQTKPAAEQVDKQLSRAFSAFVLQKLLGLTPKAAADAVVDDFNDKGIDAIYYDANSETLYLLQTKLKAADGFKQEDALPFCEGVRLLLRQDYAGFNANVQNRIVEIDGALSACSHIRLVLPFTGDGISKTASEAIQKLIDDERESEERLVSTAQLYTAVEITSALLEEQKHQPVHATLSLYKHQKVTEPRTTHFGVARLGDLVALHNVKGKALYERNIRYFLGSSKSDVNRAIKTTLKDSPKDFFYLNNGVTAVCDGIEAKGRTGGVDSRALAIRGLSIINGAQTISAAAEYLFEGKSGEQAVRQSNIDQAKVMFTIIAAHADGSFGKIVTKARNHQNPVQTANFASLDENQERLRQEMAHLGFDYRYRPEAAITADTKAIHIDEALRARALLQIDPRFPVWLKSEPARLADSASPEYQVLFPLNLTGASLTNAVLTYRALRALLIGNEQTAPGKSQERLIYRHGAQAIIAVMMKRLRNRVAASTAIDAAAIPALVSQQFDVLRQQAFDLATGELLFTGPLAYFRNQSDVASFLAKLMEKHFGMATDPALPALRNIKDAADAYPKKKLLDYLASRAPQL